MYNVYILFSDSTLKYYTGSCQDMKLRLAHHNGGHNRSTKAGVPWKVIKLYHVADRTEALRLENKIKKRGAKRFLSDEGIAN